MERSQVYIKNHTDWNEKKISLDTTDVIVPLVSEGDIWWAAV
jgi:hypothetical protein